MSTSDYLIQHARDNVWCTPDQDFQVILEPARISPHQGVRNSIDIFWSKVTLPTKTDWYHVFQIGEVSPKLLGLLDIVNQWTTLQEHANKEWVISDVYVKSGLQLPRFETYVLRTSDNNILVAVKDQPTLANVGKEPLYIRFYSNAYFSRKGFGADIEGIEVRGARILNSVHLMQYQGNYRRAKAKKGQVYAFVNGYRVQDINGSTVQIGDIVEYVWDSSIKKVVEFPLKDLPSYFSSLDNKQKYLLHDGNSLGDTIDYRDDIDLFVIKRKTPYTFTGVYYHKNQEDSVRMLTHRDYGIPVQYVNGYATDHTALSNVMELTILMHVRESGYYRPLVDEHHRIKELYKLPDADLVKALIGVDSSAEIWHAENLEKSYYPAIMRAKGPEISVSMVQKAYGYNAMAKLTANSPLFFDTTRDFLPLPVGLRKNATFYEYDKDGVMLGWYVHENGYYYPRRNDTCVFVEGVVGVGDYTLPTLYNENTVAINPELTYRFYARDLYAGAPTGDWRDISQSDKISITNGVATLGTDPSLEYTAIRTDSHFLAYDLLLNYRDGVLRFTINCIERRSNGILMEGPLEIPFGQLDLWLNGRPLIENLDYFVKWPEVCIVNKEYLDFVAVNGQQRISIRATNFCNHDMTRVAAKEYGFVVSGLLSKNYRYDLRDDKVIRIVADGKVWDRSAFTFSENDKGIRLTPVRNGAPYQITDSIIPLRGLVDEDTYSLREKSLAVDAEVSDYLSLKMPEAPEPFPNPIPRLYAIYSPFVSKVMYDLLNGIIDMTPFMGQYSDMAVRDRLDSYRWLLDYEPTRKDIDFDYVDVHPHNLYTEVTLGVYQYRFLSRAVRVFLQDKVRLTPFVKIEAGY